MVDQPDTRTAQEASPSSATTELPRAGRTARVEVAPGGAFDLRIHEVAKQIDDTTFAMLAYNGSIPGPTLVVTQGSEIVVNVTNETDEETTVHWHGLRLENQYDGVPHETQAPIPPGGTYTHRLTFPDAGLYWYHPHIREYYAQELGLYGNVLVRPADASFWPPSDRDIVLTLDDILIEDGSIAAFEPHGPNFTAMGRFGNVMLIGGEAEQHLDLQRGEVGRFYLTNTANTRVFKVALPGCRMKLVGSDAGRYEREHWVEDVVIAPSERGIIDVLFDQPGEFTLQHITPGGSYRLARISVSEESAEGGHTGDFEHLRVDEDMVAERARSDAYVDAPPDKTLALVAEMDFGQPEGESTLYVCPMHPEVVRDEPGSCPKCGMKLMPQSADDGDSGGHDMGAGHHHDHADAMAEGIEWEDMMAEVNRTTTASNMRWKAVDRDTGNENAEIDWVFRAGDQVKIRLVNEMESDHPMHHPFHIHGQRFLVLSRDGVREPNLVWKDTVLIRTGETIDLLMDASNPGTWMAHCHIPEHMAAGMMFSFDVQRAS